MSADVPRQLLNKRQDVAHAVQELEAKALALRAQLAVLDQAILILAPGWKAPAGARKRPVKVHTGASGAVPRGDVARETIGVLKDARAPMSTHDIAAMMAANKGVAFESREDRKRLTSAVLSALKRFRGKNAVEVHRRGDERELRWSLRK